jgi:hypothetical protein
MHPIATARTRAWGRIIRRHVLVPFGESDAMADATLRFLTDPLFQLETGRRAYHYAKPMFWPNVGLRYLEFFTRVVAASDTPVASPYRRASATLSGERQPAQLVHVGR